MTDLLSGGKLIARALAAEGVTHVFTLCGGHIMEIYEGCLDHGLRVVDLRHEQSAGFAAEGWARVTRRPGVALLTAGPGVTNGLTCMANAMQSNTPMVVIGGQAPHALRDRGGLQESDHIAMVGPVTKWARRVPEAARAGEYVAAAFREALAGVPGPVFLEVPLDTMMTPFEATNTPDGDPLSDRPRTGVDPAKIEEAAAKLAAAERPVVVAGSQVFWCDAAGRLRDLCDRLNLPAFLNGQGRGCLPPDHPSYLTGGRARAIAEADLALVIGTPLDFRIGYGLAPAWPQDLELIRVDLDPTEIGRNRAAGVGIAGDVGLALEGMLAALPTDAMPLDESGEWLGRLRAADAAKRSKLDELAGRGEFPMHPIRVGAEIARAIPDDAFVIGDGGDFVASVAGMIRPSRAGRWLDAGPLGTLGVGPGYAMAAKLAHPEAAVVIAWGDGSVGFNGFDIESCVRQGIPFVAVVGNDAAWSQIRRGQVQMYGEERAVATGLAPTDYSLISRAMGGGGEAIESAGELGPAIRRGLEADCPYVINVPIGANELRAGSLSV